MRYPDFLKENGTIGFVAPSFGCDIEPYKTAFESAVNYFHKEGYRCKIGPNCKLGKGIGISNSPSECGKEINSFFQDAEVDCLMSCGGGELMCEVLDFIDFEKIGKAEAKWFMGYSDNTNLTFLLPTLCDISSIDGPCAPAFGMQPWHPSIADAFQLLKGEKLEVDGYDFWQKEGGKDEEHPLLPYHVTEPAVRHCYVGNRKLGEEEQTEVSGRLLGGCLDCLSILAGTKFDKVSEFSKKYASDGILWFMESCDLNVFSVRRALWQLEHAGWFQNVKGFLIGRPGCFGEKMMGLDQYRAVLDILSKYEVPVLMDVDIGHLPPMMPIITGSVAEVTASSGRMRLKMKLE